MNSPTSIKITRDYGEFTDVFLSQEIDARDYSHLDHIGVAFEVLTRFEFLMAVQIYSESVSAIAAKAGSGEKFNLTVTLAFISLISERMQPGEEFADFIEANLDLMEQDILGQYYTDERLNSFKAKGMFLMPDKKGFSDKGEGG